MRPAAGSAFAAQCPPCSGFSVLICYGMARCREQGPHPTTRRLVLHGVDAVGLVHALLLRIQALVLPIQTLVFSGH